MRMDCSRCGRRAVAGFRYSGEALCGLCFTGLFERRVKRVVRAGRLLGRNSLVAVGVSGRRDSMVLLFLLKRFFFSHPNSRLIALTLDDGNGMVLGFAKRLCGKLGVEHFVIPAGGRSKTLEVLSRYAKAAGADRLALGISLEDELAYAMEGIMSGDVGSNVNADYCRGVKIVKPLRESPGCEIELYAKLNGIKYMKKPKGGGGFRKYLGRMLDILELRQPGCKFKLLKSVDEFRSTSAKEKKGGR